MAGGDCYSHALLKSGRFPVFFPESTNFPSNCFVYIVVLIYKSICGIQYNIHILLIKRGIDFHLFEYRTYKVVKKK